MQIASWLGLLPVSQEGNKPTDILSNLGLAVSASPSQCWNPVWLRPVKVLCVLPHSLCKFTCTSVLLCPEDIGSLESSITSGSYNAPLLPCRSLSLEKEVFNEHISFRTDCSEVFHSLHLTLLWISVFVSIYYGRKEL